MALKRKISAEAFNKLPADIKTEYKADGDSYVLDLDGDDSDALKRAKDREVQARKEAEKERDELREKLEGVTNADARKAGDIEKLEKSWKDKHAVELKARDDKLSQREKALRDVMIGSTAKEIAGKISTVPVVMQKAIAERMTVDFDSPDGPKLTILGKDGKPSALTVEQLGDEFKKDPDFSAIIVGSKASGGGSATKGPNASNAGSAGGNGGQNGGDPPLLSKMNPRELADRIAAKRESQT